MHKLSYNHLIMKKQQSTVQDIMNRIGNSEVKKSTNLNIESRIDGGFKKFYMRS